MRELPFKELASRTIGEYRTVKPVGLEASFDSDLKGVNGRRLMQRISGGVWMPMNDDEEVEPKDGNDLITTIDVNIQDVAESALYAHLLKQNADHGCAVLMEVATGEIKAIANLSRTKQGDYVEDFNYVIGEATEPGSTMKPFTVAAGLESGKYTPRSLFNTAPGSMQVYDKLIRDHENYGVIDLGTIITKSSNVGAAQIALSLPREALPHLFSRMGFGRTTGSGFPGESAGILQPPERWRPVEVATMSYGYGVTVTAMQLARAYATLASGGIERPVSFLKVGGPVKGERVLDKSITEKIMPMLESVVTADGTAFKAAVPGYRIAGKTGTAHKAQNGGYAADQYMSTFVGMAPASKPKVVLVVVIDSPNGQYYGGLVSAPVFSRIMAETLRLMNVEPDKSAEHLAQQGALPIATPVARLPMTRGAGA